MIFTQWLCQKFESRSWAGRISRIRKSRQSSTQRRIPRVECLENRLALATLTVTSLADSGAGTLRAAILDSVNHTGAGTGNDTIRFSSTIDGGTVGLSTFINDASVAGPSAFRISNNDKLVIDGQTGLTKGITIAHTGTAPFRLFYVYPTSDLNLQGLTLSGGDARGHSGGGGDVAATGGGSAGMGGAIFNWGHLTILNSTLTGNTAQGGAGGSISYLYSGGIHNKRTRSHSGSGGAGMNGGGADSQFDVADAGAGGVPNGGVGGTTLYPDGRNGDFGGGGGGAFGSGVSFDYGRAGSGGFGGGGGGGSDGDNILHTIGTYGGNGGLGGGGGGGGRVGLPYGGLAGGGGFGAGNGVKELGGGGAGMGGAVFNQSGTVVITNSTFTGNAAGGGGAGGSIPAGTRHGAVGQGLGGAVFTVNGTISVKNSTISGNTAAQGGRGIFILASGLATTNSINNTIIGQGDTAVSDLAFDEINGGGGTLSGTGNLIRTTTVFGSPNNFLGALTADPLLGPLQNNGGFPQTMAPQAGSPAITLHIGAFPANQPQTIALAPLASRTYGDADFAISATATSGLAVSLTASGNASVQQVAGVWYVHITGAGSASVTAHQAGDASYAAAPTISQVLTIAKAASVTTTLGAGPFTYNAAVQLGGSGTVTGAGGLNTSATSLTYSANSDGTGVANRTDVGTYYVTAHYAGDANHTASDGNAVAISILARHITGSFTAADKIYDGTVAAAVLSRSLTGVLGADAVSLTGGTAKFASKNVGTWTVTLTGANLSGAKAGNYALDSVATTIAKITPKALTGSASTQSALNITKDGTLSFRIDLNQSGIVDGQTVAQLFNGASFRLSVGGQTYSIRVQAAGANGNITLKFSMTSELKSILARNTTATNGTKAPLVGLNLQAISNDGNYELSTRAYTRLFNTGK